MSGWAVAGSVGASLAGAIFGDAWARGDERERKRLEKEAQAIWDSMGQPSLEEFRERALTSSMDGVQVDAGARDARRQAYQKLMQTGLSGGMDDEARLAQEEARRAAAQDESSQRQAVLANSRARGMAGGGLEFAAQLQAQQGAANRNSLSGMQAASDARRRALQSLQAGGQMAGQLESDDFAQQAAKAQAHDRIAQFNEEARMRGAGMRNDMRQQQFGNQMDINDRRTDARYQRAGSAGRRADRKRAVGGGVGQAAGYGIMSQWGGGKPKP